MDQVMFKLGQLTQVGWVVRPGQIISSGCIKAKIGHKVHNDFQSAFWLMEEYK